MKVTNRIGGAVCGALLLAAGGAGGTEPASSLSGLPTLYERLGAWEGITRIVEDTVTLHERNPAIGRHFKDIDRPRLVASVTAFFVAGTGGPNRYEGRDMTPAHAHMGLNEADFNAAVADVIRSLAQNGIGKREQDEVRSILLSLKDPVLGTAAGAR